VSNYFDLTLDTTGPSNPTIALNSGNQYATAVLVTATVGTGDGTTTGYQMKFWGDIDLAWAKANGIVGSSATATDQASALWITYATSQQLQLSTGDANKTVYLQIRDDVYNISAQASDQITLDTTKPTVTITGPDVSKVSTQAGKNVASFSFTSDSNYQQYVVKVVASSGADHTTGTTIATTNGSTNMSGGAGTASTVINCQVNGSDLQAASAGDGTKVIKVFVEDTAGNWSV